MMAAISSNQKLSQRRADSVRGWLLSKGILADRITSCWLW